MNITNLAGGMMVTLAVLIVGFSLYQQNERHFAESQRWLEVCKRQFEERVQRRQETFGNDVSLPGTDAYSQDYLYSQCYKEWHGGE